jgi:NADH:ubiquinone oxidoreductase subunit 6 (subunit J)
MSGPKQEPAIYVTAITGLITAIVGVLVAFGIDVSDAQRDSIIGAVVSLSAVIVLMGPVIRQFVTPVGKANARIEQAMLQEPGTEPPLIK